LEPAFLFRSWTWGLSKRHSNLSPFTLELEIAWDPAKARTNLAKHGVSFAQAATVLLDPLALTVFDDAHSEDEERWFTLGRSQQGTLSPPQDQVQLKLEVSGWWCKRYSTGVRSFSDSCGMCSL
jgi:hypothetical protein